MLKQYKEIILNMRNETHVRTGERRRKRMVIPTIYFIAEVVLAWLVLSLIQVNFNIEQWAIWSLLIFIGAVIYSMLKTINVYRRQKNYPTKD